MKKLTFISIVFFSGIFLPCLQAEDKLISTESKRPPNKKVKAEDETAKEREVVTESEVEINGKVVKYTAKAGTLMLKTDYGEKKASIFYIAYTKKDVNDISKRPITFSFNGGPGSSSVWLHMGLLGPRRAKMTDEGRMSAPPYSYENNNYSLLDQSDLVFIDPVSTGFSRAVKNEKAKQFHGVNEDIDSVGKFIKLFITRHKRWSSPKFLIGESYGTTRSAGLSKYLQGQGMDLNGICLVSSVLDFQTLRLGKGNDLPYPLMLPSYTATAWYHKKLSPELQNKKLPELLKEVEDFALGDYATALIKGDRLNDQQKMAVSENLAKWSGLSKEYVSRSNNRINSSYYFKELLRSEGKTIGRYDSRIVGKDRSDVSDHGEYDPSYSGILGSYTACMNAYVREELKYESDMPYNILTSKVHPWNYGRWTNNYLAVSDDLRSTMNKNPYLKVFVASGYYDLATPYFATDYTFDHMDLPENIKKNVMIKYYEAGHMMYSRKKCLAELKNDLDHFYQNTLNGE